MERRTLHLSPPDDRRDPERDDRRRASWREFRHSYPGILATMAIALVLFLAIDGWLLYKRQRYGAEVARLRAGMSTVERRRADAIVANSESKLRIMIEMVRRQAKVDPSLHLSVSIDSGAMFLERDGVVLREMPIQVGPERTVGTPPDTVKMPVPRGTRTVERVLGPDDGWEVPRWVYVDRGLAPPDDRSLKGALGPVAIILTGGAVVYSVPTVGPLNDSTYVLPGSIRTTAADLRAVVPNLKAGMPVYIY